MVRGGVTYRYVHDLLGSVRLVVNTSNGQVAQRLDYDSWGVVTSDSSPGFQPFGFAGGLLDVDIRLTRFGARDYDASTGRWTSFAGGTPNVFCYAFNSPTTFSDATGLEPWKAIYNDQRAAAKAAAIDMRAMKNIATIEYGSAIYRASNGKCAYSPIRTDNKNSSVSVPSRSDCPGTKTADIHSHPSVCTDTKCKGSNLNVLSPPDLLGAVREAVDSYLVAPNGKLGEFKLHEAWTPNPSFGGDAQLAGTWSVVP